MLNSGTQQQSSAEPTETRQLGSLIQKLYGPIPWYTGKKPNNHGANNHYSQQNCLREVTFLKHCFSFVRQRVAKEPRQTSNKFMQLRILLGAGRWLPEFNMGVYRDFLCRFYNFISVWVVDYVDFNFFVWQIGLWATF